MRKEDRIKLQIEDPEKYKNFVQAKSIAQKLYYQKNKEKLNSSPATKLKVNKYSHTFAGKFYNYIASAKARNYTFELTKEQFLNLISKNCNYCGLPGKIGIDRKDNTLGYTLENSVPCCSVCNYMKGSLTLSQFINHCKKIINNC